MRRGRVILCAVAVALLVSPAHAQRQAPPAVDLVDAASEYVVRFVDTMSNVVAEERYRQEITPGFGRVARRRDMRSEFLLIRSGRDERFAQFRDVFEVDGQRLEERSESVVSLLDRRTESDFERARRVALESSRFNIGVRRSFNVPLLALGFLQPNEVGRFTYDVERSDPLLGPDVWVVRFRERIQPSVVRDADGRNIMSNGRFWIAARSGRVLRTEWRIDFAVTAVITTDFTTDTEFPVLVPSRMEERYMRLGQIELNARATYGRFRRFGVQTEESLRE